MASESVDFPLRYHDFTVPSSTKYNILRPETVESLYILHKLTGDNVYRDWGWEIFRALEECCKVDAGYASLLDVNDPFQGVDDRMESFFLAETLKYLYLLQDPDSSLDILNEVSFLSFRLNFIHFLILLFLIVYLFAMNCYPFPKQKHVLNTEAHPLRIFDHL